MAHNNIAHIRKTFVKNLVPSYVREEYPLFIDFLESYYDFLDRSEGQLTNVIVTDSGKKYTSPTISFEILVNGVYIADTKGAAATAVVRNGRIEKIVVTSYGSGYTAEDAVRVVITDSTGSGATATAHVFTNFGSLNELTKEMLYARDVDQEIPLFVDFLRNEFMPTIPKTLYSDSSASVELAKLIKFIKSFYTSVGAENSIKFLYKILFNADLDVYYPKVDILRVSDGKWTFDKLVTVSSTEDLTNYAGEKIITSTGKTAVIQSVIPDPLGFDDVWVLNITHNDREFSVGESLAIYSFDLSNLTYFGSVTAYTKTDGYYIGDDGQPSSSKRIQDSYYYQDFSYELQSEESITQYSNLLDTIIHPAGLKYFIRLNIIIYNEIGLTLSAEKEDNVWTTADFFYESEAHTLGPRFVDIERNKVTSAPSFYQDFIIGGAIPGSTGPTLDVTIASDEYNSDAYLGYTAIITTGSTGFIRTVAEYVGATSAVSRKLVLDSEISTTDPSVSVRLIENYRPASVSNTAGATGPYLQLSPYHVGSTGVTSGLTGASGATGIVEYSYGIAGATGSPALNIYDFHKIYITTGPGSPDSRIIREHIHDRVYIDSPFDVAPTTNSTYYIHPELYGASGIYTGVVESITIVDGGESYDPGVNTLTIEAPLDGTQATAIIGATGPSGEITLITITDSGSGYITTPSITINGATGFGAILYATISNISSYYSQSIYDLNLEGGVILTVPDIKNKFIPASLWCEATNGAVTTVTIEEPGLGYLSEPTYTVVGGEGSGVDLTISISGSSVSEVVLNNLGVDYHTAPIIKLSDPYPKPGEKIYQSSTGANGVIDRYDKDSDKLYIFKHYDSPEFDASDITYNGIVLEVSSLDGTYETKNKRTNVIPEAELTSIKA